MTLRCLFVDFNSYFASVEQYDRAALRDRPIAVVPVLARSTCCIAASYEAKACGIKTGTAVWEAQERCPQIEFVLARPARYVELHHILMAAIRDCIPTDGPPPSIDEVACRLIGRERRRETAEAIARSIKQRLVDLGLSPAIRCSIGIAPNRFLAKTASDMHKPDGLTVIEQADLPDRLHALELRDLCGIGRSMEARLRAAGLHTVQQLCAASRNTLRIAWGSVEGERFWLQLRGLDVPERKTHRGSIGHSHVLGPELRSFDGCRAVLFKLLAKAAMRLRHENYLASGMSLRIRFVGIDARFERDTGFAPLDDTSSLLQLLAEQMAGLEALAHRGRWSPTRHPPLSVAVTLVGLVERGAVTAELIDERRRAKALSGMLDRVNLRYGNNAVYFGAMQPALEAGAAPMRIPFSTIPDVALEEDIVPVANGGTPAPGPANELMQRRLRQFKVLAQDTHRRTQQARKTHHQPSGAGGWSPAKAPDSREGELPGLF